MFSKMSKALVDVIIEYNLINSYDSEIYIFGCHQLFMILSNILMIFVFGVIAGEIIPILFYLAMFSFLRIYAGGYHALTVKKCFVVNVFLYVFVLLVIKYVFINKYMFYLLFFIASVVIVKLSPVASPSKPLDSREVRKYKKNTIFVWVIESTILLVLNYIQFNKIVSSILMAELTVSLGLFLETIVRKKEE